MALLDGLLHCYTPSLGPTGYRLIDRGPRRIHGTGVNIAATSWASASSGGASRWSIAVTGTQYFSGCGGVSASSRRSVSAWFRTSVNYNSSGFSVSVLFGGGILALNSGFTCGMAGGAIVGRASGATYLYVGQIGAASSTTGFNDDRWHHVLCRHNDTTFEMVVDGIQQALVASGPMTVTPVSGSLVYGANPDGGVPWSGSIGELAYWSRNLTNAEAMDIFRRGDGGLGRMLTGQSYREARLSQAIAAGGATPWLYARRRSQIIGSGGVH